MEPSRPRILIVCDGSIPADELLRKMADLPAGSRIALCPLMAHPGIAALRETLKRRGEISCEILPFNLWFHERAPELKPKILKWVHELARTPVGAGQTLRDYLKTGRLPFSLWDVSLVAEKSPLKAQLFTNLVMAYLLRELFAREPWKEVRIGLRSGPVRAVSEHLLREMGIRGVWLGKASRTADLTLLLREARVSWRWLIEEFRKMRLVRSVMGPIRKRKNSFAQARRLLVTYFPLLDEDALKEGRYVNEYYGPLQEDLDEGGRGKAAWMAIVTNTAEHDFRASVNLAARLVALGHNFSLIQEWARAHDLVLCLWTLARAAWKSMRAARHLRHIRFDSVVPAWELVRPDWFASLAGFQFAMVLMSWRSFTRIVRCVRPSRVLYPAELHAWEKVLNHTRPADGGTQTIGLQHTTVPVLLFGYFHDPREFSEAADRPDGPYPNLIACVGGTPARLLREGGWPLDRVVRLGAIRFGRSPAWRAGRVRWEARRPVAVVVISASRVESRELLGWVSEAFGGQSAIRVLVKGHPSYPLDSVARETGWDLPSSMSTFREAEWEDIRTARCVIAAGTSVAMEALACGTPVVIARLFGCIDINPLSYLFPGACYAHSPEELKKAVTKMFSSKTIPLDLNEVDRFLDDYCDFPTRLDDRLRRLDESLTRSDRPAGGGRESMRIRRSGGNLALSAGTAIGGIG